MITVAPAPAQTTTTSSGGVVSSDPSTSQKGGGTFLTEILSAVSTETVSKPTKVNQPLNQIATSAKVSIEVMAGTSVLGSGGTRENGQPLALKQVEGPLANKGAAKVIDLLATVIPGTSNQLPSSDPKTSNQLPSSDPKTSNQLPSSHLIGVKAGSNALAAATTKAELVKTSSSQQAQTPAPTDTTAPNLLIAISQFQSVQASSSVATKAEKPVPNTTQAIGVIASVAPQAVQPHVAVQVQSKTPALGLQANASPMAQSPVTGVGQPFGLWSKDLPVVAPTATPVAKIDNPTSSNQQPPLPSANSFEGAIGQVLSNLPTSVTRPVSVEVGFTQSYSPPTDLATPLSHIAISLLPHDGGKATVELSMSPANLGPITATLSVDKSSMTVLLGATNQQTAELLTKHSAMIASELSKSSGLTTTIDMSNGGGNRRGDGGQRPNQPSTPTYSSTGSAEVPAQIPQIIITSAHVVDVTL